MQPTRVLATVVETLLEEKTRPLRTDAEAELASFHEITTRDA